MINADEINWINLNIQRNYVKKKTGEKSALNVITYRRVCSAQPEENPQYMGKVLIIPRETEGKRKKKNFHRVI